MPICLATVTAAVRTAPDPNVTMHWMAVDDVHRDVAQMVEPSLVVGVVSARPKFCPVIVTSAEPDVAPFSPAISVTSGAAYVYACFCVPTRDAKVIVMLRA